MITIHTGILLTQDLPALSSEIVKDTRDYTLTRQYIYEALSQEKDLEVFVLTRICDDWFWDLVEYFDDVRLVNDAPTELLKLKLSVNALPTDLAETPEVIVNLDLLNLSDPPKSVDVWEWIIENKLGTVWTTETPSEEHLSELIIWYLEKTIQPILQPKTEQIAQQWVNTAHGKLRSAYALFLENPGANAYSLITWRILAPYDRQLKEEWLAAEGWYSHKLESLADMIEPPQQLSKSIRNKLNQKIRIYWNTKLKVYFND